MSRKLPSFEVVRVGDIKGLHPAIEKISRLSDNDYMASPLKESDAKHDIWGWLILHPILCSRISGQWLVIAGFRSWEIVCAILDDSDQIPILALPRCNMRDRLGIAVSDALLSPAWLSLGKGRTKVLGVIMDELRVSYPDLFESKRRMHPELRDLKRRASRIKTKSEPVRAERDSE